MKTLLIEAQYNGIIRIEVGRQVENFQSMKSDNKVCMLIVHHTKYM